MNLTYSQTSDGRSPSLPAALRAYAWITALATLALLGIGGLVTSHGVGMAVPDWPTTYGYNMFFFPISQWTGGVFYEHSHRLVASLVGLLVVGLTRALGGTRSRLPLAITGGAEIVAGFLLLQFGPAYKGTGHFLAGIGGVVLAAAAVWARHEPAPRPLPALGWAAFVLVQVQGLLGGLRVVLFKDELGVFHAALAQLFFVLVCTIALLTTRAGRDFLDQKPEMPRGLLRALFPAVTALILGQLILGAVMRHQHAGLAIPDFPLAYGKLWPSLTPDAVARYNQQRLEVTALNPITAPQIVLQIVHRLLALAIAAGIVVAAIACWRRWGAKNAFTRWTLAWAALVLLQVFLGAATIWTNKAADLATAHVLTGALLLEIGASLTIATLRSWRLAGNTRTPAVFFPAPPVPFPKPTPATGQVP